ncbi:uncharacterized protein LOC116000824 isoform X2 [Ipomoea triloba]|uniref:uncharacterized protein LOC116000824 isoform X2 n=1 Tax=Ipomoea triloba TaxID=35885 RepID=UPI00125E5BE3|nr:uncharacterized protein LOC116000824 isoform X2 [Ipomoea triloba]
MPQEAIHQNYCLHPVQVITLLQLSPKPHRFIYPITRCPNNIRHHSSSRWAGQDRRSGPSIAKCSFSSRPKPTKWFTPGV